ncbi:unnamed protein product [Amoebophrya sp. A25]|nr:unnamed protein product [Amoebophrya sp. A25]|eukprot:GSA25T00012496001.1
MGSPPPRRRTRPGRAAALAKMRGAMIVAAGLSVQTSTTRAREVVRSRNTFLQATNPVVKVTCGLFLCSDGEQGSTRRLPRLRGSLSRGGLLGSKTSTPPSPTITDSAEPAPSSTGSPIRPPSSPTEQAKEGPAAGPVPQEEKKDEKKEEAAAEPVPQEEKEEAAAEPAKEEVKEEKKEEAVAEPAKEEVKDGKKEEVPAKDTDELPPPPPPPPPPRPIISSNEVIEVERVLASSKLKLDTAALSNKTPTLFKGMKARRKAVLDALKKNPEDRTREEKQLLIKMGETEGAESDPDPEITHAHKNPEAAKRHSEPADPEGERKQPPPPPRRRKHPRDESWRNRHHH